MVDLQEFRDIDRREYLYNWWSEKVLRHQGCSRPRRWQE